MSTYNWEISNLERNVSDGGVTIVHWRCTLTDGDDSVSSYGTLGLSPDPESAEFIAYDSLTKEAVLSWLFFSEEGFQKNTENALADRMNEIKTPSTASGMPWQSEGE